MDFAEYLKEARKAAGLNQSELAARVGLTGSYISVLESRRKPPPSDPVLRRLAATLGKPEEEMLEVAHLDRTPVDIRRKIRALDRRLSVERKLSSRLLSDLLPSSLWLFWRVRGYHEAGLERLRFGAKERKVLRKVLRRIGHLTRRDDFLAESRRVLADLPEADRAVLAEVLPELVAAEPGDAPPPPEPPASLPLLDAPPGRGERVVRDALPVTPGERSAACYFLAAADDDMLPRIEEGDLLLVDPELAPEPGDLVLVVVKGRVTVRQLSSAGRTAALVAANPRLPPVELPRSEIRGVVREVRRRFR